MSYNKYKDIYINLEGRGLNHHIKYGSRYIIYPCLKFTITVDRGFYLIDLNNLFLKYGDSFRIKLSQLLSSGDIFTDRDIMNYLDTSLGFQKFIVSFRYKSTPKKLSLGNLNIIKSIHVKQKSYFKKPASVTDIDLSTLDLSRLSNKLPGKSLLRLIFDLEKLRDYCKREENIFNTLSSLSNPNYCINDYSFGIISLILTIRLCNERNKNYLRI